MYMDLFDKDDQHLADTFLDYYDGESKEHLIKFLQVHRKNSLRKGMVPRTRNLVKTIVDKSGMLFNGKAPKLEVQVNEVTDDGASELVLTMLESANWVEFFNNFDKTLRMLKTCYVLVQVDPMTGDLALTCLSQKNAAVEVDLFNRLKTLVYCTGEDKDYEYYRVWHDDLTFDLRVNEQGEEEKIPGTELPNPFGLIPAAVFHDTNTPREDAWNEIPSDLVEINDIYNLHLTDSEFSAMWVKMPTLFTNATIQGGTGTTMESVQHVGEALPRWVPSSDVGFVGGPGTVVGVETNGDPVYLDYKGPTPDLKSLDDIVLQWVNDFASDWCVSIAKEGNGQADSGFKLIVKELPNLELRKERQRMMEAGFRRLYRILVAVGSTIGINLPEDGVLIATFGAPELPVDEKASEEVWDLRIKSGRASRVDYLMEVKGLSLEQAVQKIAEIDAFNGANSPSSA